MNVAKICYWTSESVDEIVAVINRSLFPKFDCEINLEKLKDRIVYTLVNADSNKSRLKTIPYRLLKGTDLAITYKLIIDIDFNATASSDVTNALMEHLGVTENDLYTFATKNTRKLYAPSIMSLTDIVSKIDNQSQEDVSNTPETIFVLTNFKKHFGASCILYPDVLKNFCIEKNMDGVYMIPSSVHEFLLLVLDKKYVNCGNVLYWAIDRECLPMNPYLSENELQFCYLGSINNIIDIPRITAFLRECSVHKKCTLHIIGDGENKEYFIQEVLCVGVNVVDHKEVYDFQRKQEVFDQCNYGFNVMKSSVVVGLTMKSLDYMCAGLPIINTIKGDTKDFCEEWDIGFNLKKSNIKEVAERVCSDSMDVQLQRRRNIQNLYNTYFTTKHFNATLQEALERIYGG